jgi:hypothetical protein
MEQLQTYPELKERFKEILRIVENSNGDTTLANDAEERIIEELRGMGHDALQSWAIRQAEQAAARIVKQKKGLRKHVKKKCAGIAPTEK